MSRTPLIAGNWKMHGTIEEAEGPKALVAVGSEKFFSNGLDLDHIGANPNDLLPYLFRVHSLFTRILSMPCATVAAQNGHMFAAGAMLAICHDHRIMREYRDGYDFSHDLLRETAYTLVSPPKRWLLHRRVAQALELLHPGDEAAVVQAEAALRIIHRVAGEGRDQQ